MRWRDRKDVLLTNKHCTQCDLCLTKLTKLTLLRPYPIHSPFFWKAYVVQMRPYLLFVSGIAGLSGMAMSQSEATPISVLLMAFLPFFLGYGFGQALTDCFQTDTDKISS